MSYQNPLILVPTAFSPQSLSAVDQAISFAKHTSGKVLLLTVTEPTSIWSGFLEKDEENKLIRQKIEEKLRSLAAQFDGQGVDIETRIEEGTPYEMIKIVADEENADIIIMGTNGAPKGIRKRFIGSNAMRVVSTAKRPVITIKGSEHNLGIKNIILPLDLTKETKQKVGHAISLAKLYGSTIHVVTVINTNDDFVVKHLKANMRQVHDFIEKEGVKVNADFIKRLGDESFSSALIHYGIDKKGDLFVIMTQEETSVSEFFVGSLAQKIIYHSPIPVLSIRPKQLTHISSGGGGLGV